MFFDEDGDLAHEFYEETCDKKTKKRRMKRLRYNLKAQVVYHEIMETCEKVNVPNLLRYRLVSWPKEYYNGY